MLWSLQCVVDLLKEMFSCGGIVVNEFLIHIDDYVTMKSQF